MTGLNSCPLFSDKGKTVEGHSVVGYLAKFILSGLLWFVTSFRMQEKQQVDRTG